MIGKILALLILGAILFFPAKMLWNHFVKPKEISQTKERISDTSNIGLAAQRAGKEIVNREIQKKHKTASKKHEKQSSSHYTFWNSLEDLFGMGPNSKMIKENNLAAEKEIPLANRKAILFASNEVIKTLPEFEEEHLVTETGSTPAEFVLATIKSPVKNLSYELNGIRKVSPGYFRVSWKIKNDSGKTILLNKNLQRSLSPVKIQITDFSYQNTMPIQWYPDNTPIANCLLSDRLPPFGRVTCSALVGPRFDGNEILLGNKVRVKLPGARESVNVYLNV
ncbi:MAG: hypothetical protein QNJ31_06595 [Candidatus Caenarcaniphilales bacterium]|nr:hypothetical protein [Candidatus Caenarcaniphilales bacterium]